MHADADRAARARATSSSSALLAENEGRWESLGERDRERVEAIARAIVKRLLHEPTERDAALDAEHRHARLQLLRELFGLEEPRATGAAEVGEPRAPTVRRAAPRR